MKGVTDAKGLRNLKTATTRRIRAKPPQSGTAHLDMYLLGKEKQRLEQELAHLDERRGRIHNQLAGIARKLVEIQQVARREEASDISEGLGVDGTGPPAKSSARQAQPPWQTMPLEY